MAFQYTDRDYYGQPVGGFNSVISPEMGWRHHNSFPEVVRERVDVVEVDRFGLGGGRDNFEVMRERVDVVDDRGCFGERIENIEAYKYRNSYY
ncbi:hypothetical protein Nepgr_025273 [Nepenthes gracilis]|uniref:Uncharacterized protein n=1 Tax=Nepenthes gracilis TaxID=150966 RepID=A0AAD3Y0W6_NEPGR|nr:hypothetical protein Nepgr_025273 [Nepenthes gracilis]